MTDSKQAVMRFYDAVTSGDPAAIAAAVPEDFCADAPPMLPWGGTHRGRDVVLNQVSPLLAAAIDVSTLKVESMYGEGDRMFVTVTAQAKNGETVTLGEDWTLRDGKPWAVRVYWFDPRPVMPAGA